MLFSLQIEVSYPVRLELIADIPQGGLADENAAWIDVGIGCKEVFVETLQSRRGIDGVADHDAELIERMIDAACAAIDQIEPSARRASVRVSPSKSPKTHADSGVPSPRHHMPDPVPADETNQLGPDA